MAFVNECLVLLTCSVILVESKPVVRVVSPAEIAVKLLHRHKFDRIHTKVLDIVELSHSSLDILRCGKVTEKHFIDHEVVPVLDLEILMLPAV